MKKICFFWMICCWCGIPAVVLAQDEPNAGIYQDEEHFQTQKTKQGNVVPQFVCGSKDRRIRVAGFTNYPPFGWVEQFLYPNSTTETYSVNFGIGNEIFKKIADEQNLYYEDVFFPTYLEAKNALELGKVDVLTATYYDSNPYSVMEVFYPAYISNPFVVISLKGKLPPVKDLADLTGKKGIIRWEENLLPLIQPTLPEGIHLETVSGARNAFKKLVNQEADYLLTSRYAAEAEMRRFKVTDFMDISEVIRNPNFFLGFSANNGCAAYHKEYFEKRLKELTADKDYIRSLLSKQIVYWEQKFRKEPSIMLTEGFEMKDETEQEIKIDEQELEKIRKLKELDPEVLIQQEMEKMNLIAPVETSQESFPSG